MEELAKLLAKASAEIDVLTKKNTELEQELAIVAKKHQEEREKLARGFLEDLSAVKETERTRSAFLAEIVNRPLKRAREIATEHDFDMRVVYQDGKYCPKTRGTEALNSREALVSVVSDTIMGQDAIDCHGEKIWAPAAVFPYRI